MKLINTLRDIWKIEELKQKLLLTLGLIAVYRFMAQVPLPGIDPLQLTALKDQTSEGLLGLLNAFTGGAFSRASIIGQPSCHSGAFTPRDMKLCTFLHQNDEKKVPLLRFPMRVRNLAWDQGSSPSWGTDNDRERQLEFYWTGKQLDL